MIAMRSCRAKQFLFLCMLTMLIGFWHSVAFADAISLLEKKPDQAIGKQITFMRESGAPLTFVQAANMQEAGKYIAAEHAILGFGIGSKPVWMHFSVSNPTRQSLKRRLLIEAPWLDQIDAYFVSNRQIVNRFDVGDSHPFSDRQVQNRFFAFDHRFDTGVTDVYLRIETDDPMVVPIYLMDTEEAAQRETIQGYSYGFLYGYLLALIAYNLLIYMGLRDKRNALYAGFVAVFFMTNIAYTGHGFAWLWPESVRLERWVIPSLMVLYGISGLTFAKYFLDTRNNFPRTHKLLSWMCWVPAVLLPAMMVAGSQFYVLIIAFAFVALFSFTMLVLGLMSAYSRYIYSRYFLLASITSMLGTSITTLSVWGFVELSEWKFRAVEIGMLIDATLLALALTNQLRLIQQERKLAVELAASDPLTRLNNRRSFLEKVLPVWSTAQRNKRDVSMVILDIDNFKSINDQYGHSTGDAALVAIAEVLAESARDGDIVARWGGEEFLFMLPETKLQAALVMAERLRKAIAEINLSMPDGNLRFTASFGVAQKSWHQTLDELISEADDYLYQSKTMGRNRVTSELG